MQMIQLNTALNNIFVMFVISLVTTGPFLEISSNLKPHASPQLSQLTLFRWIPVASYDNSQSDIDVMFEYKYVSIPREISSWQTNILQQFAKTVHVHISSLSCPYCCSMSVTRHSEYHAKGTRWAHPGLRRCPAGLTYLLLWRKQCRCFMITDSNLVFTYISYVPHTGAAQLQSPQPQLKDVRRQASGRSSVLSLASLQGISSM